MEIASKYNPAEVEDKWYKYWLDNGFFKSKPDDREPYTIVIPPPNVTGVLHMGHMLNNTIQDILVRRARMMGKNACWVPGTDHASIATEAKVVNKLAQEGIKKQTLAAKTSLSMPGSGQTSTGASFWNSLKAGRFLRLGPYRIHHGRCSFGKCNRCIYRPVQQRIDIPRCTNGKLGPQGTYRPFGRRGCVQRSS